MTMATYPDDLRYTKDHEWARVGDGSTVIGITDYAQRQLGDVVYLELPKVGDRFDPQDPFGSVESVKAVSEVYMPFSCAIVEVNDALNDSPELVNQDPYGEGWIVKVKPSNASELDALMGSEEYAAYVDSADAE
jgi:glycine cleavage system H protein